LSGPPLPVKLSVNVDHVATVRQARRAPYPDPVEAAGLALAAGASGITVHLRVDRRHVQDADLPRLREAVREKLNVEMSTAEEMVGIALAVRPEQVTLVAERPEEVTTEGGLDLRGQGARVAEVAGRLAAAGIAVSVFIDPDPAQIEALSQLSGTVSGFELNTDVYTRTAGAARDATLGALRQAGARGRELGFHLYAGHGLTTENVGPIAALPGMEELNIGHALIARAVMVGLPEAVREMLAAMAAMNGKPGRGGERLKARRRAWGMAAWLALTGCAGFGHLFKDPKVKLREAAISGLSTEGADLTLDFDVMNPNGVGLPVQGIDYKVWVNGERFLAGSEGERIDVPAHGAVRVRLPVTIRYDDFVRVLKSLKDHPLPDYDIEAEFRFAVPVVGTVRVPVREHRTIPVPELKIHLGSAARGRAAEE
jgi:pyridoxine 5-phosphate synthase